MTIFIFGRSGVYIHQERSEGGEKKWGAPVMPLLVVGLLDGARAQCVAFRQDAKLLIIPLMPPAERSATDANIQPFVMASG